LRSGSALAKSVCRGGKESSEVDAPGLHFRVVWLGDPSGPSPGWARRSISGCCCWPLAWTRARPKATPGTDRDNDHHDRVRHNKISKAGTVTLRVAGRLRHIGVGRTYAGTYVILLAQDLNVRVVHAATGELLRELTIDARRDNQPTGRPPGPTPK